MPVVVKGKISRNAGHHYGQVRVQRVEGVTADSTVWTADTIAVTADGKVLYIPATLAEPVGISVTADTTRYTADNTTWPTADGGIAGAADSFDAVAVAGGAVIPADVLEPTSASDLADAVSDIAADAVEPANALDGFDAVTDVAAAVDEPAAAIDDLVAAVGAQILSGTVAEAATALDALDADVISVEVPIAVGGGAHYPRRRPLPVYGVGYGILPELEGEAHGVVGVAGKSAAQILVHAAAVGASGQAGDAAVVLKGLSVAAHGATGVRGSGEGVITKFSGSATGRHDDDEAAVIAFLLAA